MRPGGGSLLRYQKRFAGLVAGSVGRYHSDPLFAQHGMLKIGDLYRQQVRVHAWRFWNGLLPEGQAAMLSRVSDVHGYGTRSARAGLFVSTGECWSVGYRVPTEWATMTEEERWTRSLAAFKGGSQRGFLGEYGASVCDGVGRAVCGGQV